MLFGKESKEYLGNWISKWIWGILKIKRSENQESSEIQSLIKLREVTNQYIDLIENDESNLSENIEEWIDGRVDNIKMEDIGRYYESCDRAVNGVWNLVKNDKGVSELFKDKETFLTVFDELDKSKKKFDSEFSESLGARGTVDDYLKAAYLSLKVILELACRNK